ncbi:hypothetical protein HanXRQr2_Chr16g0776341 [Helianthus annuus]|uniref:Uncharacterized protein n=1 Tax=Helianthus annuus TaxID=4232 RepID=A0A9K3DXF1_HELAN|nr:hypothetical protein HanXRQr2_Chr16g0776341 [Helianthus annuus]KAJ0823529.1 hypothetical protein HanPSC8_Chr16g0744791 [Helianthus annuus]
MIFHNNNHLQISIFCFFQNHGIVVNQNINRSQNSRTTLNHFPEWVTNHP